MALAVRGPRRRGTPVMNVQTKQTDPLVLTGRNVTAILGPTNTGKTHLAIERMVAHSSGVIGLPLRLLAREVYTRVCEKVGTGAVQAPLRIVRSVRVSSEKPARWLQW